MQGAGKTVLWLFKEESLSGLLQYIKRFSKPEWFVTLYQKIQHACNYTVRRERKRQKII